MNFSLLNYYDDDSLFKLKRELNRRYKKIVGVPHPFLKWAGGKRQLLNQIDKYIPISFNDYIEPFVGGGALFFYLLPEKAVLIDNNPNLISTYQIIKENVEELIEALRQHENEKNYYYKIRNADRNEEFKNWSNIEKASRIIYLNRCCYNGLYRVNSKGQFNVPFGKYKNPNFCDEENLRAVHLMLQNVEIIHDSFEICLDYATEGSFLYFDPPYSPLSETANFTSYTKESFTKEDHVKLKRVVDILTDRGSKVMLSNSYNELIMELYNEYFIRDVSARRVINSDASKRGAIKEILITNYKNKSK